MCVYKAYSQIFIPLGLTSIGLLVHTREKKASPHTLTANHLFARALIFFSFLSFTYIYNNTHTRDLSLYFSSSPLFVYYIRMCMYGKIFCSLFFFFRFSAINRIMVGLTVKKLFTPTRFFKRNSLFSRTRKLAGCSTTPKLQVYRANFFFLLPSLFYFYSLYISRTRALYLCIYH